MIIDIEFNGTKKQLRIERFKALDGWELQNKFLDFAASTDRDFRLSYTMEVLQYANVIIDDSGREMPLSTKDVIDNHLGKWENVQKVFEDVLRYNGIDPKTHADRPGFWSNAGAEMAVSFMAEAVKLMGPAFKQAEETFSN
ncbi:hypothetical protein PLUTO_00050 [Luteibacter phage vB_LflM-Pluto]|uniref:Phage protein n=1 Tax=Luteibacter phage vB_LflM-Pluto TaxID=2948611 RepID=A0A9E7MSZ3_9CAUD|nr:hypothetical protein PLUTO_00050 [Luteibacter phage vB_LflM-Pluto]